MGTTHGPLPEQSYGSLEMFPRRNCFEAWMISLAFRYPLTVFVCQKISALSGIFTTVLELHWCSAGVFDAGSWPRQTGKTPFGVLFPTPCSCLRFLQIPTRRASELATQTKLNALSERADGEHPEKLMAPQRTQWSRRSSYQQRGFRNYYVVCYVWSDCFVCWNNEVILIWLRQQRNTSTGNGF